LDLRCQKQAWVKRKIKADGIDKPPKQAISHENGPADESENDGQIDRSLAKSHSGELQRQPSLIQIT
jgi:hypothetical protein